MSFIDPPTDMEGSCDDMDDGDEEYLIHRDDYGRYPKVYRKGET